MHSQIDWRSVRFDWNRARAFLVAAEEGSLSAAARALGTTQPTLGRQVAALEKELGVVLFDRGVRELTLTPSGLELFEHVRSMGEAANLMSLTATGQSDLTDGIVSITMTDFVAAYLMPAIVEKLRAKAPGITIELIATNDVSDLGRRAADIAVRHFRPAQPSLIARKVCDLGVCLYASDAYYDAYGRPETPSDLKNAIFIGYADTKTFLSDCANLGYDIREENIAVLADNQFVQWELIKRGIGMGIGFQRIGDAEPSVSRVLPEIEPVEFPLWLVTRDELRTNRRIQSVFDVVATELARLGTVIQDG